MRWRSPRQPVAGKLLPVAARVAQAASDAAGGSEPCRGQRAPVLGPETVGFPPRVRQDHGELL